MKKIMVISLASILIFGGYASVGVNINNEAYDKTDVSWDNKKIEFTTPVLVEETDEYSCFIYEDHYRNPTQESPHPARRACRRGRGEA